jgi:eukaryotic-like serine/threonine-protein kinase
VKRTVGRYSLHDEIASGGMATVYLARQRGEKGFARVVAVKMLHAQYAKEEAFRAMFLDEARLVSRIRHPNVVATLDVLEDGGDLFLVMDYVHGDSLSSLLRSAVAKNQPVPKAVASAILVDTLEGLHAAHEATSELGAKLDVVHRDVSPQNLLVGVDGVTQVADFGVAKAVGRLAEKFSVHHSVKGKAGYMAPEQVRGKVDRRTDVYAAGVVLWEMLTGERLYTGESYIEIVAKSLDGAPPPPSSKRPELDAAVDAVVLKALALDPKHRFATAREMAMALERAVPRAGARDVGEWVRETEKELLERRREQIARIESGASDTDDHPTIRDLPIVHVDADASNTIAGVAPTEEAGRHVRGSAAAWSGRSRKLSRWWWLGLGAAAAVSAAAVFARPSRDLNIPTTAAASAPAPTPSPSAPVVADVPVAPSTPSAAATGEPQPSSSVAGAASAPRTVHRPPPRPRPAPESKTPPAAIACHWEQLPDEDGILIPKRVCP